MLLKSAGILLIFWLQLFGCVSLYLVLVITFQSFQPVLHNWANKGCGMMHIKEPMLLIGKSITYGGSSGFLSRYLNGPLPYV